MKKKKNGFLLASAILSSIYVIWLFSYFSTNNVINSSGLESLGMAIAIQIVKPYMYITAIALVFNWIAWAINAKWAAIATPILYIVAISQFPTYFSHLIVQIVLCFVGFATLDKIIQYNLQIEQQNIEQQNIEQSSSDNSNIV